jgi:hypothetical protein
MMKWAVLILTALVFAGCGGSSDEPAQPAPQPQQSQPKPKPQLDPKDVEYAQSVCRTFFLNVGVDWPEVTRHLQEDPEVEAEGVDDREAVEGCRLARQEHEKAREQSPPKSLRGRLPSGRTLDDYPDIIEAFDMRWEHKPPCGPGLEKEGRATCTRDGVYEHYCVYGNYEAYEDDCSKDVDFILDTLIAERRKR